MRQQQIEVSLDDLWRLLLAELDVRLFTEKERKEGYRTKNFLGNAEKYKSVLREVMQRDGIQLIRANPVT